MRRQQMRGQGRWAKGQRLVQKVAAVGTGGTSMSEFPWKNPLKGGIEDVAMAEVSMKGAGLFVGFKVKF